MDNYSWGNDFAILYIYEGWGLSHPKYFSFFLVRLIYHVQTFPIFILYVLQHFLFHVVYNTYLCYTRWDPWIWALCKGPQTSWKDLLLKQLLLSSGRRNSRRSICWGAVASPVSRIHWHINIYIKIHVVWRVKMCGSKNW